MTLDWKQYRQLIEYGGIRFLAWFVPLLSRDECMGLSKILGSIAFFFDRRGRAVSLANLEAVFGNEYSPEQRFEIGLASYQNFARTMVDLFWAPRLLDPANHRYLKLEGPENLREKRDRCAVVILTHKAGFEWTGHVNGFNGLCGVPLTQAFKNKKVGEIFTYLRQIGGQKIITQEASMLKMLKSVKRGGFVGMLIDLNVMPSQASTIIDAFGMKMCVTILHAVLAQRANALIIPMESEPLADGSTKVILHTALQIPPEASIQEIVQICWNFFEPIIRAKPHLWMWTYKHWRFKPKGTTRQYPFYANESGKFEKLLKEVEGGRAESLKT
jgi:lauroyl/myristoyl acyltransferase